MLTSVVIPCHDGADDTQACLRALSAQRDAGEIEVVLVDNGSKDRGALQAAALAFPRVRLLRLEHNLGFAAGTNHGLAAARGDVLVVLNNDTMPAPSMLARMRRGLEATPKPTMVAPVSNYVKGSALLAVGPRGQTEAGRAALDDELEGACGGQLQDIDTLSGLCLMFERSLLAEHGGFDADFGLGNYEDDDLALRVRRAGGRLVIARDAFLHHWGSRTFAALGIDYQAQMARNRQVMQRKWQDDPAWGALTAAGEGALERAGELAARALVAHPRWPEGHLLLAKAATARAEYGAACEHAEHYLRVCPTSWTGYVTLVVALLGQGRLRHAARTANLAITSCYVEAEAAAELLSLLAQACAARGARAAARDALRAAIELAPHADRFHHLGTLHYADGERAAAQQAFAAGAQDGHLDSMIGLGVCQWENGQPGEGLRTLTHALLGAPEHPRARQALAAALQACADGGVDVRAARAAMDAVAS